MADEELASYRLQFQQVEAALLGDPDNEELQKLKTDLEEVIALQVCFLLLHLSSYFEFQIGDRVMAPLPNGNRAVAVVDSLTAAGVAVIFISSGQKTIVDPSDLSDAPDAGKKHYVFDSSRSGISKSAANKKEWLAERERRRLRAQKKEMKRKELDLAKESEKNSWIKFNHKAVSKGIKGMKRIIATGSAQDGPAGVEYLCLQCFIIFNHGVVFNLAGKTVQYFSP
uniref:Survival of motor neuron-related-splicing factor 30 n=1 Tax=Angiostrongylus cantonensis TaxID=6313 RepID=A0A0K0D474_ANGCA